MQKIHPMLWFDNQAEEAANLYVSIFKNSKITAIARWPEGNPNAGQVLTVNFQLDGVDFTALNGGPIFKFTEAVSLVIDCDTQDDVDHYWDKLIEGGGEPSQCGWLKDKYGLSWQVVPKRLMQLLQDKDKGRAARAMEAMMKMSKIDIKTLEEAAEAGAA